MAKNLRAVLVAVGVVACHLFLAAQVQTQETNQTVPIGVRILTDTELFPPEPDGPGVFARLARLGQLPDHQRNGNTSTAVRPGYAPRIDRVITKYGKPDRIREEPREFDMAPDRVYYWGDCGLAVRLSDATGQVSWVRRVLPK